ncbi:hypothetical protein AVEN_45076-1, partial [Araneus ventricosus]
NHPVCISIGIAGNEVADEFAKKSTKEGPKFEIPASKVISRYYSKPPHFRDGKQTWMKAKQEVLSIISYQKYPTSHHSVRGMSFNSLAMDPFPASLKASISITQIFMPVRKWATLCTLLLAAC